MGYVDSRGRAVAILAVVLVATGVIAALVVRSQGAGDRLDGVPDPVELATREEISIWYDLLEQRAEQAGVDHLVYGGGSDRTGYYLVAIVDDPSTVDDTGFPPGLVTVARPPEGTVLRDGVLHMLIPDDLPSCDDVDDALCETGNAHVVFKEGGCMNPPTTTPPGGFDEMHCSL